MSLLNLVGIKTAPSIVTLVGAGGKTSVMFDLAREARLMGLKVVTTPTTRMRVPTRNQAASIKLTSNQNWRAIVAKDLAIYGHVCIGKNIDNESDKLIGIDDEHVFSASRLADLTIVEGDGACGLPVKGTEAWEPLIPHFSNIVIYIIGLDCLGRPANKNTVHKPAKFLEVTGLKENDQITPSALATLATHSHAGRKNVPPSSKFYVLLNKSDTLESLRQANEIGLIAIAEGGENLHGVIISGVYESGRVSSKVITKS